MALGREADELLNDARAEAASVLASMRLTAGRWMPQLRFERELAPELEHPIVCALRELSTRAPAGAPADAREVLAPFVSVLASPHAHAPVLHSAAASISRLVAQGALARADPPARGAALAVSDTIVARLSQAELGGGALANADVLEPLAQRLLLLLAQLPCELLGPAPLASAVRVSLESACSLAASYGSRIGAEAALMHLTRGAFGALGGARAGRREEARADGELVDALAGLLASFAERAPHPVSLEALLCAARAAGPALSARAPLVAALRTRALPAAAECARAGRELCTGLAVSLRLFAHLVEGHRRALRGPVGLYWQAVLLDAGCAPERLELLLEGLGCLLRLRGLCGFLYVKYDCALCQPNLFESTLAFLATHAMPRAEGGVLGANCALALSALVAMLAQLAPEPERGADGRADFGGEEAQPRRAEVASGGSGGGDGSQAAAAVPSAGAAAVRERRELKRLLFLAAAHFNRAPAKGLGLLRAKGLLPQEGTDAERVAAFLHAAPALSKAAVGDYLGEPDAESSGVLAAYVRRAGLRGLGLLAALRRLLGAFRLPGEAQKISRVLEAFAAEHAASGSDAASFGCADSVYVLAYSLLMLNTDLHNNNVKRKMGEADFLRANRGVNGGGDFAEPLLRGLYAEIKARPLRLAQRPGPGMSGADAADGGCGAAGEAGEAGASSESDESEEEAEGEHGEEGAQPLAAEPSSGGGGRACRPVSVPRRNPFRELCAPLPDSPPPQAPAREGAARASGEGGGGTPAHAAGASGGALRTPPSPFARRGRPSDAALTAAHGCEMLELAFPAALSALSVALDAASAPATVRLALRGLRLLARGASLHGLGERLDTLLLSLCMQAATLSRSAQLAAAAAAEQLALAQPAAQPPAGAAADGAQPRAADADPAAVAADTAGAPSGSAALCAKFGLLVRMCLCLARECAPALRESWLDVLGLLLRLREMGSEQPAAAAAAGVLLCAQPLASPPDPRRAEPAASPQAAARARAGLPSVPLDEAVRLHDAPLWPAAGQLALMGALQGALQVACADGSRDTDQLSPRACLDAMGTLFLACAPGAGAARARALWAPLGEVLGALADPDSGLAPDAPLAGHTVTTCLRLLDAIAYWPAAAGGARGAPALGGGSAEGAPSVAEPLRALLAISPEQLELCATPIARALAALLAQGADAAAGPRESPAQPAVCPCTELLALLQNLAALPHEPTAGAVCDGLAAAVAICAAAQPAGSAPSPAAAAALAQCATTAVTAARTGLARPGALLAPLQAAHAALAPAQGLGSDALRALCAIARERAEARARAQPPALPATFAAAAASASSEMVARSAGALVQLLLLAGAPAGDGACAVWLQALGALCACVDSLRGAEAGRDAPAADEHELVEQAVLNLLLCAAKELGPPVRAAALGLVRASRCAPETVAAAAAALHDGGESAASAMGEQLAEQ